MKEHVAGNEIVLSVNINDEMMMYKRIQLVRGSGEFPKHLAKGL